MFESLGALGPWTLGVVLGLPLGMLLLTEVAVRLRRGGRGRWAAPVLLARNFILPTLALYILLVRVVGLGEEQTAVKVVLTLLWVSVLYAALTLLNVVLFEGAEEGSWQSRVPKLLQDLGRLVLVLIGLGIVLSAVWGQSLAGLVTALGVGTLAIGLALQDPMGNLFSGLMLMFERPFSVGDFIKIGETTGKVVEINWRAVHILVRKTEIAIVPNSTLSKGNFTNLSRPTREYAEQLFLGFSYDDPPNKVKRVLKRLALETQGVVQDPPPSVSTHAYDNSSITYKLTFRVADYSEAGGVKDELLTRVWYAAKRDGLSMPFPTQTQVQVRQEDLDAAAKAPLPEEALQKFGQLGLAKASGLEESLRRDAVRHYAKGEVVVARGESLPGLCLVLRGEVSLTSPEGSAATEKEVARLGAGEFFGEKALLSSSASEVTVTAVDDVELVVLEGPALRRLVDQAPHVAREIGAVLEARREALRQARDGNGQGAAVS